MNTKMDTIKVSIKRLGKIANSEVEINRMVLFTGESGLGKSYMAILCHYFFYLLLDYKRMASFFHEKGIDFNEDRKAFKNKGIAKEILKSELEAWMAKDAIEYMRYMLGYEKLNGEIVVHLPDSVPEKIVINYEEQLVGFTDKEEPYILLHTDNLSYRVMNSDNFGETPYAVILRHELLTLILSAFKAVTDNFVFPPSRGFALSDQFTPVTGLYESYHKTLLKLKKTSQDADVENSPELVNSIHKLIDGKVEFADNKFIYHNNGTEMPISAAAASIRELAPFEFLIEKTTISKDVLLIEEPEAHLHPLKQRLVADVISLMNNAGAYMQITTHSDYFLRRLNELILLQRIKDKADAETYGEYCRILSIDPNMALQANGICAYILLPNEDGTSRIEKQDLCNGIPFTSFVGAIEKSLSILDKLENFEDDEDC